jgi:hypothetical protein
MLRALGVQKCDPGKDPERRKVVSSRILPETGCNEILARFIWLNRPQQALTC